MNKYALKYLLLAAPFVLAVIIETFILPVDFFTFRVWEALFVKRSLGILHGPFFPDVRLAKTEERGDLQSSAKCAREKDVVWMTDRYGYRKSASPDEIFPVVIVGDSTIAGAGLTQEEMLSEVLEKKVSRRVYPLAPGVLEDLFDHPRIKQFPPDIVILANIERFILATNYHIPSGADFRTLSPPDKMVLAIQLNPVVQKTAVVINRVMKTIMLYYLQIRINIPDEPHPPGAEEAACPVLFLEGKNANRRVPDERIDSIAANLANVNAFFKSRGVRFIFLPIPNKENFYYQQLGTDKPQFLTTLIKKLRKLNVEVVDTQTAFDEAARTSEKALYPRDDTHWNAEGVKVAADLLETLIQKPSAGDKNTSPTPQETSPR